MIEKVLEFRKVFRLGINENPTLISKPSADLHARLLQEELDELKEAQIKGNLVEVADALGDIMYLVLGAAIEYGLTDTFDSIFNEIHASNMSKLDANGCPIVREDGKILKSELYFKPDIKSILNK